MASRACGVSPFQIIVFLPDWGKTAQQTGAGVTSFAGGGSRRWTFIVTPELGQSPLQSLWGRAE